jgi:hypothetical protein
MERHILVVATQPVPGGDQAYNEWYDHVHLPEVLGVKGFQAAQRFCLSGVMMSRSGALFPYLAIYEIETDDIETALADLRSALPEMTISDTLDQSAMTVVAFRPLGERVTAGEP